MLRHSTSANTMRFAAEPDPRADRGMSHRDEGGSSEKHVLRLRPSFVRLPRAASMKPSR
jgi:hypothetical protein